jgi:tRNA(Ile)-lysidine synthase
MKQHPLMRSVEKTLLEFNMLQTRDRVLVAVSGGPDSVALLHVLLSLGTTMGIQLGVAHLDHGLRPSAAASDAAFVARLAAETELPLHMEKTDIQDRHQREKGSLESVGRRARYDFFSRIAEKHGYDKIALGHHADDNAELVLMNLFRGSGPLGLSGIPPVRGNRYIRPLIQQPRTRIMHFLQSNQIAFVLDASNSDLRFLRNRVRHQLMPELIHRYNPNLVDTLNRTAAIIRSEEDWLNRFSDQLFDTLAEKELTTVRMPIAALLENHAALQRRTIRTAIAHVKGDLKSITLQHIDAVLSLCQKGVAGQQLRLPGRLTVRRPLEDQITISRQTSAAISRSQSHAVNTIPLYRIPIGHPMDQTLTVPLEASESTLVYECLSVKSVPGLTSAGQNTAFLDMDKLTFPLHLRNPLAGDRFTPLGMQGTQKVKRFFINNKVPRHLRRKTPVLVDGDTIVWIVGYRIDDGFKITQQTRNVLKIELLLA